MTSRDDVLEELARLRREEPALTGNLDKEGYPEVDWEKRDRITKQIYALKRDYYGLLYGRKQL